ncbi:hypothetical protein AJ80_08775 [Polytolypa hystricis UAMH7299]|uniref:FAD/NAD(P)-binding domain-containing protein n=1 Tax=Polytolypa hystricis (strain UAMH7299) TaxID=1447883 RepID=A0A2B7WUE2_POLH7|nr:hypothetical protein AJ80_08775 [Polytolypa hystricis UAMH7299]
MAKIRRVVIIGAGPAGAIAVDALAQENAFDLIRVFERREKSGGCWLFDQHEHPPLSEFSELAKRTADKPLEVPETLPAQLTRQSQQRYAETSVYPYLETNVDSSAMEFSVEKIPVEQSERSISIHGKDTPFRPWQTVQRYIEDLVNRNGYQDFVEYNTTVERVTKKNKEWEVILRKQGEKTDTWWKEHFDAVVVANGHYSVPYIPEIEGLAEFEESYPRSVEHSKAFRGREKYRNKRVIVVGASVSGADIATDLIGVAQAPINAVVTGHRANAYFGDAAFQNPGIRKLPSISRVDSRNGNRTVHFQDGTFIDNVDKIIFSTGYSWSLPFLPQVPVRNNRVPDLYLHIFHQSDPTLTFVGAVAAGLTFKVFEWQSVLVARVLAGRAKLPSLEEQQQWEIDRIAKKGDSVPFTALFPDFEDYFETVRRLAGDSSQAQPGRKLPRFRKEWVKSFMDGHQKRIRMWQRWNKAGYTETDGGNSSVVLTRPPGYNSPHEKSRL